MERIGMRVKCDDRKKVCSACGTPKLLCEFYDDDRYEFGVKGVCKECCGKSGAKYRKTKAGIKSQRKGKKKYLQTEYGQQVTRAYSQKKSTRKRVRDCMRKRRATPEGHADMLNSAKKYKQEHPEQEAAHQAIKYAVRVGNIPHPDTFACVLEGCSCGGRMEYHHFDYSRRFRLAVVPLCKRGHERLHMLLKERRRPIIISLRLSNLPPLLMDSLRNLVS